eukprot:gnl/MRDRNA2_/MRDRNA2_89330_c0_seq1.p1 gnl/MRDRNA2_/MRDRNA2_89330_c0~~gnl/MRDRNA2_/MRDRNA2_89330_c0_seq1.p1  ORF type:complete len:233 (+),score=26.96 gnl/MRDRNA2_/MRDRNA2_89330_c0_seq1:136-834(+)
MSEPAKLYYFHGRGKSQQSRWVLAAAKVPFQNVCLSSAKEIRSLRQEGKLTYNQVPMLEIDNVRLSQSMAIVRHAARLGKLEGATPVEQARVDEIVEGISDSRNAIIGFPFQRDALGACQNHLGAVQKYFPVFEELVRRNGNPPFAVGSALTVADVLLAELVDCSAEAVRSVADEEQTRQFILDPYPQLRALHSYVLSLPQIKAFMSGPNWFPFPTGEIGRKYVSNVQTVLS